MLDGLSRVSVYDNLNIKIVESMVNVPNFKVMTRNINPKVILCGYKIMGLV
jgi:hypothetical protein